MALFNVGGSGRPSAPPPAAAHDPLSLSSHQSPVLPDAGNGRLTWGAKVTPETGIADRLVTFAP